MTGHAKKFVENATMSFKVNNKQLLKIIKRTWKKTEKLMILKIDFESKPIYGDDDKYIKTKMKIYADNMITIFHDKKNSKEKAPCKFLSIIMLDSVSNANKIIIHKPFWKNVNMYKKRQKLTTILMMI